MPSKSNSHTLVLISLLLGMISFAFSYFFVASGVNTKIATEEPILYLAEFNSFKTNKFGPDTIWIYKPGLRSEYIKEVTAHDKVEIYNSSKHDSNGYIISTNSLVEDVNFVSRKKSFLTEHMKSVNELYLAKVQTVKDINHRFFNHRASITFWMLLISIAIGVSSALTPLFLVLIWRYAKNQNIQMRVMNCAAGLTTIFALLFLTFVLVNFKTENIITPNEVADLFNVGFSKYRIIFTGNVPYIAPVFWVIMIIMFNGHITQTFRTNKQEFANKYQIFRKEMERYFVIIGIYLGFTIFCTSNLLSTLNYLLNCNDGYLIFPNEFSYVHGTMQTFLIVLIFFLVSGNLNYLKSQLSTDEIATTDAQSATGFARFFEVAKIVLTMLSPLLGSGLKDLLELVFKA